MAALFSNSVRMMTQSMSKNYAGTVGEAVRFP